MKFLAALFALAMLFPATTKADFFLEGLAPFAERHCHDPAGYDTLPFDGPECDMQEQAAGSRHSHIDQVPQK